jgi:ABC-type lipoprotein export system ATPase subunit
MTDPLLQLQGVEKSYSLGGNTVKVFSGLEAAFHAREVVTIQGASGTGKTTLLHLLGGLDQPDHGEIVWQGQRLSGWTRLQLAVWRRDQVGLVFQSYHLLPELSALENVELPALIGGKSTPGRAEELLSRVGLEHRLQHRPTELSGGEQQRVAIARCLRNRPQLVLADEPTGNLDRTTGEKVMALLLELCREQGTTLILVTHDASLATLGDRKLLLENGLLREV